MFSKWCRSRLDISLFLSVFTFTLFFIVYLFYHGFDEAFGSIDEELRNVTHEKDINTSKTSKLESRNENANTCWTDHNCRSIFRNCRVWIHDDTATDIKSKTETNNVDIVYTWVDGSDERFKQDFENFLRTKKRKDADILMLNRYIDFGLLKYSLRSVERYANWIRNIFLVTNGQIPTWLKLDDPRLILVTHEHIFPNKSDLPTFASQAVECHFHRIKGLSKRFIYMYNDVIFTSKNVLEDFVTNSGQFKVQFNAGGLKGCNGRCRAKNVNNGICEQQCYTESCEWDGDDCIGEEVEPYTGKDKRFMFDAWKGSIMHTNFLFNKAFGPRPRLIPKGGPHMFDKNVLKQINERGHQCHADSVDDLVVMQNAYGFLDSWYIYLAFSITRIVFRFPKEWARTSSQKLRHHLSINMQFAYYNYLIEAENMGIGDIKTNLTKSTKCCEMVLVSLDNRYEDLSQQLVGIEREIKLKKPRYLIVARQFTRPLSNLWENNIKYELEAFLEHMFPYPSLLEI